MKKLIINPVGGLANRMRAIASGISLYNKIDASELEIAWPVNQDLFCEIQELFEYNEYLSKAVNISNISDLLFYDVPRKKNLYLTALLQLGRYGLKITDWDRLPSFAESPARLEAAAKSVAGTMMIRSGMIYYNFEDDFYRSLFKPRESLVREAEARVARFGGKCVGLHIRRTDNVVSIRHSPLILFIEAVNKEIESDSEVSFYIATDDYGVKSELVSKFGRERFVFSDKTTARDSSEGIKEALTELIALSKCSKIYGSYWSSFSEAAAIMGNVPLIQLKI